MGKLLAGLAVAGLVLGPPVALTATAALMNPALTACLPPIGEAGPGGVAVVPETTAIVMPIHAGTYAITDRFGGRVDPFTGESDFHDGTDFGAADGTPILATADGRVRLAGNIPGWGNMIVIDHTVGGQPVSSVYLHMWDHGIYVTAGQTVTAGQQIGEVGSSGRSTGPHLHFEIRPGGWPNAAADSLIWLTEHGAISLDDVGLHGCTPATPTPTPSPSIGAA